MSKIQSALPKPVYINSAVRTPIGKFGGSLTPLSAADLASSCLREALNRSGDKSPDNIDFVFMGHGRQAGGGPNTARQAAIFAGLNESTCATTMNHACASGMVSIIHGCEKIVLGRATRVLAGGVESMSNTPYMSLKARWGNKMGNMKFEDGMYRDGFHCPMADMVMGSTVENFIVPKFNISRSEQDEYAQRSQEKTAAAEKAGLLQEERFELAHDKLKTPLNTDEHARPQSTIESLTKLPPVFDSKTGSITAGNSSGITDGSAFVELSLHKSAQALAEVIDWDYAALDPKLMGLGPIPVVQNLLRRHSLQISDIAIIELNEAFAAQAIACQKELGILDEQLNPLGGAIAIGHPIGATGARITATLAHQLHRKGPGSLGIACLCVSGGQGVAILLRGV